MPKSQHTTQQLPLLVAACRTAYTLDLDSLGWDSLIGDTLDLDSLGAPGHRVDARTDAHRSAYSEPHMVPVQEAASVRNFN